MFEPASIVFAAAGVAVFAAAVLPRLLRNVPVSMPMIFLGAGMATFTLMGTLPDPDPIRYADFTTHLTEVCVIVSLMGAGLAIDRPPGFKRWATTWRMLGVVMPLSMVGLALLGLWVLGLGLAAAVLVAAVIAPTDPVLASEVKVGEPADDEAGAEREDEVRFGLTSEAGLNDGLAFPFVYLAISLSVLGASPAPWLAQWFVVDVLWRIGIGVLLGFGTGKLLARIFFSARHGSIRLAEHSEGFVALAAVFLAYGATEMVEGYGFVSVFICALTIRAVEHTHGYHRVLHSYVEQLERLLTVVVLVLLGGAVARGLLHGIGWREVLVALAFLLVLRPAAGLLGLAGGGPSGTGRGRDGATGPHRAVVLRRARHRFVVLPRLCAGPRGFRRPGPGIVGLRRTGRGAVHCPARGVREPRHEPAGPAARPPGTPAVRGRGPGPHPNRLAAAVAAAPAYSWCPCRPAARYVAAPPRTRGPARP